MRTFLVYALGLSEKYKADFEKFKSDFPAIYYESIMVSTNAKLDRLQQSIITLRNNTDLPAPAEEIEQTNEAQLLRRLNDFFEFNYEELVNEFALYQETYHLVANMQRCFPVDDVRIVYFVS